MEIPVVAFRGHFDGKVIIPAGVIDLPRNRELLLQVASVGDLNLPSGVSGASLLRFAGSIGSEDIALMQRAIQSDCEQVTHDEW